MNTEINLSVKDLTSLEDDVEKARLEAVNSFERLVDKLFKNIHHDIDVVLNCCKFNEDTLPLCGRWEDVQYYKEIRKSLEDLSFSVTLRECECKENIVSIRKKE